ncbi:hypothetical protein KM043_005692 [Ampulex compressa]|nr:hypothetical protein KM043_005692 [Ampulex compressa]
MRVPFPRSALTSLIQWPISSQIDSRIVSGPRSVPVSSNQIFDFSDLNPRRVARSGNKKRIGSPRANLAAAPPIVYVAGNRTWSLKAAASRLEGPEWLSLSEIYSMAERQKTG